MTGNENDEDQCELKNRKGKGQKAQISPRLVQQQSDPDVDMIRETYYEYKRQEAGRMKRKT